MQMYQKEVFGDPLVNIGFGAYGTPGAGGDVTGDNVWQWRGNFTKIKGKHSLKAGGQYHRVRISLTIVTMTCRQR